MANLDAPLGFRAVENGVAGTAPRLRKYTVKSSLAIGEGDLVALNSTAQVIAYTTTDAVAGDLIGVAAHPVTATQTSRDLMVYDDPQQIFEVQADGDVGSAVNSWLGKLFKVTVNTLNTTTLQSKHELDASASSAVFGTVATQVYPLRVVGVSAAIDNTDLVSYTRYLVQIHPSAHLRGNGAGIG